jgi:DNA-directed RNA polymerase subunit beta
MSEGVKSIYNEALIPKGQVHSGFAGDIDYTTVDYSNWTEDENTNSLIARLLHNYSIKVNEEVGRTSGRNSTSALVMNCLLAY